MVKPSSGEPKRLAGGIVIAAAIVGMLLFAAPIVFGVVRHFWMNQRFGGLGEFGDFVGGFANPLLALLGYLALLYTVVLQRQELSLSRDELALTRQELERSASALEAQAKHFDKQSLSQAFLICLKCTSRWLQV